MVEIGGVDERLEVYASDRGIAVERGDERLVFAVARGVVELVEQCEGPVFAVRARELEGEDRAVLAVLIAACRVGLDVSRQRVAVDLIGHLLALREQGRQVTNVRRIQAVRARLVGAEINE